MGARGLARRFSGRSGVRERPVHLGERHRGARGISTAANLPRLRSKATLPTVRAAARWTTEQPVSELMRPCGQWSMKLLPMRPVQSVTDAPGRTSSEGISQNVYYVNFSQNAGMGSSIRLDIRSQVELWAPPAYGASCGAKTNGNVNRRLLPVRRRGKRIALTTRATQRSTLSLPVVFSMTCTPFT